MEPIWVFVAYLLSMLH